MEEQIKEIVLRHWIWDVLAILLVVSAVVVSVWYAGIDISVYPTNVKTAIVEDFNDNILNVNIINDTTRTYYEHNITEGNISLKPMYREPVDRGNMTKGIIPYEIGIENPYPNAKYIEVSFNISFVAHDTLIYDTFSPEDKACGFIGLTTSAYPHNTTYGADIYDFIVFKNGTTTSENIMVLDTFVSEYQTLRTLGNREISYTDFWDFPPPSPPPPPSPTTSPVIPDSSIIYRDIVYPKYEVIQTGRLINAHVKYVINYEETSNSYIEVSFINMHTNEMQTLRLPFLITSPDIPKYIYIILPIFFDNTIYTSENNVTIQGVYSLDNIKVSAGNVKVEYSSLASAIFIIFGFIVASMVATYGIVYSGGFSGAEIFILAFAILILVTGVISYIIPQILLNTATLTLTVITAGLGIVWGAFATGKIEFKGEIDEWLAEHGDALFVAFAVITVLQYLFVLFP